jgi:hypothetical protein
LASTAESSGQARERHSIASGALSQDEDEGLGELTRAVTSGGGGSRRGQQKSQRAGLRARSLSASLGGLFTRGSNRKDEEQGKP